MQNLGFNGRWAALFCLLLWAATGCAAGKLQLARQSFYDGRLDYAAQVLGDEAEIPRRDRLLYFLEKGIILHHQKDYAQSIRMLRQAADLIDRQEVISASRQTGSLVTSERLTRYKGEYAERLWVHTYLMMNYLLIHDPEDALVEAKQALEVFDAHPDALEGAYFTRALIAHCFEANNEVNGAYIEYKKLAQALDDPSPVADRLVLLARRLGFYDEAAKYEKYLSPAQRQAVENGPGPAVILFISQGRSPVKIPQNIVAPPSIRFSFATYRERTHTYEAPSIHGADGKMAGIPVKTDIADVLSASLKERAAQIIAKETARVVAKEAISQNINDAFLEVLVRGAFFVLEEPDTRSWQTLPAFWTLIRIPLSPERKKAPALTVQNAATRVTLPAFRISRQYTYFALRDGEPFIGRHGPADEKTPKNPS